MANVKISGLPAASAVADANEFEINEAGTSKKVTGSQIASYVDAELAPLKPADIGSTVQAYDADTTKNDVANTFTANQTINADLTVDTSTLKVDSTNNRVGIGTPSPSQALDVVGNIAVSGTVDGRDIATNIPSSLGTAGQVLTVNSGATATEWADASSGGGVTSVVAFVLYDQTIDSLIDSSSNVSSVSDNATGRFSINLSSALPSTSYLIAGSGRATSNDNRSFQFGQDTEANVALSTTVVGIAGRRVDADPDILDCPRASIVIYHD